jgi:hypothetical protein
VGQTKQNTLNLWLGIATISVLVCVCLAAIIIAPRNSIKVETKPLSNLSYREISNNQKLLTGVQWDEYEKSIMGQRVQWQGIVGEVKSDNADENIIWIDMDNPPDGIHDVYFNYPAESSLNYSKGQQITFQGEFDGGIEIFFFMVELVNAEILP